MHAHNRRVDHLHGGVVGPGERAHNLGPDARASPANETVVAGRVPTEVVRQVTPWRPGPQDPEDAIEDAAVIHSWHTARLIGQHRLDGNPFVVGEFVAHDSGPSVRGLESRLGSQAQRSSDRGRVGRDAPGSGRIMLTLSFVACDPKPTSEPHQAAALPKAFAPARRISAENSGSFTARASTIAPTIPLIVASAFSRRAGAERPVTNVARTSMKSRRPLVKAARTGAGWRTASAARQAIAQPRPAPSRWRADR